MWVEYIFSWCGLAPGFYSEYVQRGCAKRNGCNKMEVNGMSLVRIQVFILSAIIHNGLLLSAISIVRNSLAVWITLTADGNCSKGFIHELAIQRSVMEWGRF